MHGKHLPLALLLACAPVQPPAPAPGVTAFTAVTAAQGPPQHPDADRDADGFRDHEDRCPDEPGREPDGCPVRDTDLDGIFDDDDDCPDAPESRNRYHDHDGCPDQFPAAWALLDEPVYFGVTVDELRQRPMSELTPAILASLKKVAALLRAYPELQIELIGHHDSAWKLRPKQSPSGRRVLAARKFLVEREKIKARRIRFRTAGTEQPLIDNASPDGPLRNNRLEFLIQPN